MSKSIFKRVKTSFPYSLFIHNSFSLEGVKALYT
ncbi:hypothetical protein [Staphylococcus phage PT94]